jgi:hypothetical protein
MAVNLQVINRASTRIDNTLVFAGTTERGVNFEITGLKYELTASIANSANAVIYNSNLTAFSYLVVEADENVRILITDNSSASFSVWLRGTGVTSRYGLPLQLGNDNTTSTYIINTLQAFNTSGNTAKVHILVLN